MVGWRVGDESSWSGRKEGDLAGGGSALLSRVFALLERRIPVPRCEISDSLEPQSLGTHNSLFGKCVRRRM